MRSVAIAAAWLALAVGSAAAAEAPIRIDGGMLAPAVADAGGVRAFKGLPYAAPPTGDQRWRPPQPATPWSGVHPSDRFGPNCLQPKRYADTDPFTPSMSEDCLYLNVWTAARAGERRPVFVWIHGGGYGAGAGSEPRHDGTVLAGKGVVVVTINYRLGPLGFLAHPDLTAESPRHVSGDYGLMDMIAALKWVKANIAGFGGDPARVTIAGESAGSDAVSRLMASPLAHGLFQRAIGESGAGFNPDPGEEALPLAERQGVVFARGLHAETIAQLRGKSSAELLAQWLAPGADWRFAPVIDGWVLPESEAATFAARRQNDVPLIVGWNRDEGVLFEGALGGRSTADVLRERLGARAGAALPFYPSATPEEAKRSHVQLAGDVVMNLPTWSWARAQAATGRSPVYLYRFDHHPPVPDDWFGAAFKAADTGAFHSGEIAYVFGHPAVFASWTVGPEDRSIADLMSSDWAAFAASGDPNGADRPAWPRYDPKAAEPQRMEFDVTSHAQPVTDEARLKALSAR